MRARLRKIVLVLHASSALALVACGGASFQNGVYDDGIVRYRVAALPSHFERVHVEDNDLAWNHPEQGTISVNSTCTEYEDVPATALVNHLLFDTTERSFRLEEMVTLDGRGARHVIVDLELDGVPVSVEIYLLRKDGCVYDLTYVASRDAFEGGREAFQRFVRAFSVLETRLPR